MGFVLFSSFVAAGLVVSAQADTSAAGPTQVNQTQGAAPSADSAAGGSASSVAPSGGSTSDSTAAGGVAPTPATPGESVAASATTAVSSPQARAAASQTRVIGRSVQGRKIVARLYGSPSASRVGVVIGSMHGTELAGIPIAKRVEKYGARAGTAIWVIRDLNPDGSRIKQRGNANKVDLNRNGVHIWQSKARAPDYYPGKSAASEPETRAYIKFLEDIKPDVVIIYHQRGTGVDSYRQKNAGLTNGLAKRMKLPVKSFNCDGECTGTLTGWFNTTQDGAAITIELPATVNKQMRQRSAKAARWAVTYVPDTNR